MNNFSLSESLIKLKEKNYDSKINETISILLNKLEEHQLLFLSHNYGLKLDNNIINLFFIEGVGFRCYNDKDNIYGKLPICRNIESFMNKLYLDYINEKYIQNQL